MANKIKVGKTSNETPAHVFRSVFESAQSSAKAWRLLIETPIASPAIFSFAETMPDELCMVDRTETEAFVQDGPGAAANSQQADD